MPRLFIGTSGYSYKEWKGSFYPEKLSPKKMLSFYGERFDSVEINNTFYRLPRREVLETWASQVPASFRFAVKASRRITHQHRINEGAASPLQYLLDNLSVLGDKLGTVLFQLPPYLKKDLGRLQGFLELLPDDLCAAFEFRNVSWYDDEVFSALSSSNAALVLADTGNEDKDPPFVRTADWGYLRLRRTSYGDEGLATWAARLADPAWTRAFVYFKHEDEGTGPELANRLKELTR